MDTPTPSPSSDTCLDAVSYDLTLDDCENSMREPLVQKAMWKNMFVTGRKNLVFLSLMGVVAGAMGGSSARQPTSIPMAILGGAVGALLLPGIVLLIMVLTARRMPSTMRRNIENGTFGNPLGPNTAELRQDGLYCRGPMGESLTRWTAIQRIEQGTSGLLFFLGPINVLMIPHRALSGAGKFESRARELHAKAGTHMS